MHVRVSNRSAIPSTSATLTLHPRLGAILQVVNSLGHALLVQPVAPTVDGSATATLNLQGIPSGQYQLRLTAGTTLVDIHTLIVQ